MAGQVVCEFCRTAEGRERERSLPGLPGNVCHRFSVNFSTVQLTVEKTDLSDPVGRSLNILDKKPAHDKIMVKEKGQK